MSKIPELGYLVTLTEHERGWGSRVDCILSFSSEAKAIEYASCYNKTYNNQKEVPDYYIAAEFKGPGKTCGTEWMS